jgi:hypothetical protein
MDPELTALAAAGANTMVSLMLTDAWSGAKKLVTRFFTSGRDTTPEQISSELETSRHEIQGSAGPDSAEIQQIVQSRWETNLLLRLQQQPELASLVAEIVEYGREQGVAETSRPDNISIQARASGNARVYQQGHGVQHNG